ncbi:MAG TPA: YfhO family protein, partial [Blastocatellia bacterium]|nr:YfhO family protein [Blastocatellia bacterium]
FVFPFFFGGGAHPVMHFPYWGGATLDETSGYFGLLALLLGLAALLGSREAERERALIWFWGAVALVALILSFGGYLPFDLNHTLHRTPVYNLFRASGRHMYEFNFAMGLLAGFGATLLSQPDRKTARRVFMRAATAFAAILAVTVLAYRFLTPDMAKYIVSEAPPVAGFNSLSNSEVWIPLLLAVLCLAALWLHARRNNAATACLLLALAFADLWGFSFIFNYGWRDYVSNIGRRLQDPPAVKFIKSRESNLDTFRIVSYAGRPFGDNYDTLNIPNVSMARGLQSVNGYDALRLTRHGEITGNMGSDGIISDNSLFDYDHQGLNLLNVKYMLMETQGSDPSQLVEIGGVRFKRERIHQSLETGKRLEVNASGVRASELAIVSLMANSTHLPDGAVAAKIKLHTKDGRVLNQELQVGRDTAEWAYDKPEVNAVIKHRRPTIAESDQDVGFVAQRFFARLPFERAEIERFEIEYALPDANLLILRMSLFDATTGQSFPLDAADAMAKRWRKLASFDGVSVYENLMARPRAWFVRRLAVQPAEHVRETIKDGRLKNGTPFDPAETALFEKEDFGNRKIALPELGDPANAEAKVTRFEPNRIELQTRNQQDGFLVVSEMYYRGWEAWLDGKRVPVEKVDYVLRGLFVPAGEHRVEFIYRAHSFRNGAAWSLLGLLLLFVGAGANRSGLDRKLWERLRQMPGRLGGWTASRKRAVALLIAALLYGALLAHYSTRAVGGSDSSGYARLARALLQGDWKNTLSPRIAETGLFGLSEDQGQMFVPLAYAWMPEVKRMGPIYPVGFPLHIALLATVTGLKNATYLINPILAVLCLLLLYALAREMGLSPWWALAGVLILAGDLTFLGGALQAMSDLSATFWALAAVLAALRSRRSERFHWWAMPAGAAFGVAFLVRPSNIALLAPLLLVLRLNPKSLLFFGLGGVPLAALFFGYNYVTFGHPLQTGYAAFGMLEAFKAGGYATRVGFYAYWLTLTLSPLIPLGWLGLAVNRAVEWRNRAILLAWFGSVLAFYGFYTIYNDWSLLRFLLPGYPALIVGALLTAKTLLDWMRNRISGFAYGRLVGAAVSVALLLTVMGFARYQVRHFNMFLMRPVMDVNLEASRWAERIMPPNSLIVCSEMSGPLDYYTERPQLRWDLLTPEQWPALSKAVSAKGYQFFAVLMPHEIKDAQQQLPGHWIRQNQFKHISLWLVEPATSGIATVAGDIIFGQGFSKPEFDDTGESWRWMGEEGWIELPNTGEPMRLKIEGLVPLERFSRPSKLTFELNGQSLAQVAVAENLLQQEFVVTPAQQGTGKTSWLRLHTDQVFIPSQADPKNKDPRQLGFSLTRLSWGLDSGPPNQHRER